MANRPIEPAERLSLVSEYYFSRKLKEVAQLNAEGKDIISLAIGSPDMPPSPRPSKNSVRWLISLMHTVISPRWEHQNCVRPWLDSTSAGTT